MAFVKFTPDLVKPKRRKMVAYITNTTIRLSPNLKRAWGNPQKVDIAWDDQERIIKLSHGDTFDMPGNSFRAGKAFCRHFGIDYRGPCEVEIKEKDLLLKLPKE